MNQDKDELLPCPFCGGIDLRFENLVLECLIKCRKCKAGMAYPHGSNDENGKHNVIKAWNTRIPTNSSKER